MWRLWPHEDATIVNSDSQKHDVKKEVPRGISNVESNRETTSCCIKQWQRDPVCEGGERADDPVVQCSSLI